MNYVLLFAGLWLLSRGNASAGIGAGSRSTWFVPYYESETGKKTTVMPGPYAGRSGVYFIKEISTGKIVYVGYSTSQLKDTIYRHFREWGSSWGFDPVYYRNWKDYKVRVIECAPGRAELAEKYFIRKFQPRDNKLKYEVLAPAESAKVEKAGEIVEQIKEALPW